MGFYTGLNIGEVITNNDADVDQVAAYARDLQEYHFETRDKAVKAVLVLTGVKEQVFDTDGVKICAGNKLSYVLDKIIAAKTSSGNIEKWLYSKYAPLPTIVEAARMFMRKEELPAIKSIEQECFNDALDCLEKVTEEAKREGKHVLAFVTGVPGSGKTFLGLQFVYDICDKEATKCDSVYLSGNGPLVKVLQDALKNKAFVKDLHNSDMIDLKKRKNERVTVRGYKIIFPKLGVFFVKESDL